MKAPKKACRPTRAEASALSLEMLVMAGIDPDQIDPKLILASIARDASAPAIARVAACKALLAEARAGAPVASGPVDDPLTVRALEILNRRRATMQ